ncbi:E3 ubiquitin-protein ligase RNF139 [Tupaia chinensis]|uniref:E3 ubiquitin-protein ligase RNF139 n=1 Tax=Tupaia chinensis TaxID=246437 RepID=L9JER6_TUPCH|nr:E3 ubiquitin-protein ligase RNF139 [Tupaia chinensis]
MAHQQVWAALEVGLRVPCLYIIDAIFNSYYDSSQGRFCIVFQIFLRLLVYVVTRAALTGPQDREVPAVNDMQAMETGFRMSDLETIIRNPHEEGDAYNEP